MTSIHNPVGRSADALDLLPPKGEASVDTDDLVPPMWDADIVVEFLGGPEDLEAFFGDPEGLAELWGIPEEVSHKPMPDVECEMAVSPPVRRRRSVRDRTDSIVTDWCSSDEDDVAELDALRQQMEAQDARERTQEDVDFIVSDDDDEDGDWCPSEAPSDAVCPSDEDDSTWCPSDEDGSSDEECDDVMGLDRVALKREVADLSGGAWAPPTRSKRRRLAINYREVESDDDADGDSDDAWEPDTDEE